MVENKREKKQGFLWKKIMLVKIDLVIIGLLINIVWQI